MTSSAPGRSVRPAKKENAGQGVQPDPCRDCQEIGRLRTLIEASETLCSTLNLTQVLNRILNFVTRELTAERSTLYLLDEKTGELVSLIAQGMEGSTIRLRPGEGVAGYVARTGEVVAIKNVYNDPRFAPWVDRHTGFRTSSVLTIPMTRRGEVTGVIQVLNRREGQFDDADEGYLLAFGGLAAMAIENARLHEEELALQRLEIEKEHLDDELRTARSIQEGFLPREAPRLEGIDVAGTNMASEHVSGDYYDFLPLSENRLGLVVADVAGHGIPAALLMSMVHAALWTPGVEMDSPGASLARMNGLLYSSTDETRFATMFLGILDVPHGRFRYASGGHNPPLIFRARGEVEPLGRGGLVLGILPDVLYEEQEVCLESGDLLLLYTDGVTESLRGEEMFGEDRLISLVKAEKHRPVREIVQAVLDTVLAFGGRPQPDDDVTLIALRMA